MRSLQRCFWCWAAAMLLSLVIPSSYAADDRLGSIRARDRLTCGIWPHVRGFAHVHAGQHVGFEVDICRAIAAAVLGDADKVQFEPIGHVSDLARRESVDVVVRRLTWTPRRALDANVSFGPVVFYDGQAFLVRADSGIGSVDELVGKTVCVLNAERHPATTFHYFKDRRQTVQLALVATDQEAEEHLQSRRCAAYSADLSWLAAARAGFKGGAGSYRILDKMISKEPLAPVVRSRDAELARVVAWTIYTLIEAEELQLTSANIPDADESSHRVSRFLSMHPIANVNRRAGEWSRAIIAGVGNYREIYERNLGEQSGLSLERGPNRLWTDGGLLYAPPLDR